MGFSIVTEYPVWFILICLLAGFVYAWLLYQRSSLKKEMAVWLFYIITACRFVLVTLLCFLLLGPMLKMVKREVEKPLLIIAMDASESMKADGQTGGMKKLLNETGDQMEKIFDVQYYSFGDHVRNGLTDTLNDRETDFSDLYQKLDIEYLNRNVGALIIASDGLYNKGANPVYGPERLKIPVYTIAYGDTTVHKDLAVSKVDYNKTAFLGNNFPLNVTIDARQCSGTQALLTVSEDSVTVFQRAVSVSGNNFHTSLPVLLEAKKKGIHSYKIHIQEQEGEKVVANNTKTIFIEVISQKEKILILESAPNPDIAALRQTLETSPNYEVNDYTLNSFKGKLADYNLVILHAIPGIAGSGDNIIQMIKASGTPVWLILGANTSVADFNNLKTGIQIASSNGSLSDALPLMADEFSLFSIEKETINDLSAWPPLKVPFGVYSVSGNMNVLLYQKIAAINTRQPLLALGEWENQKTAVLCGEGIWKWKMYDYSTHLSHQLSDGFILKIVQFLITKEQKSPFRVYVKGSYNENESVNADAELTDQSGQLTNLPDAKITFNSIDGKQYPYTFSKTEKAYSLNAGQLPAGMYHYKAEVKNGTEYFSKEGNFSISPIQIENAGLPADFNLLRTLANQTGGNMYKPEMQQELIKKISQRDDLKPVIYNRKKLEDLINLPWIFVLLMVILSMEWFIRKWSGAY